MVEFVEFQQFFLLYILNPYIHQRLPENFHVLEAMAPLLRGSCICGLGSSFKHFVYGQSVIFSNGLHVYFFFLML